jgi:hypothetical protein
MFRFSRKTCWVVYNCLTGEFHDIERLPFEFGNNPAADLPLNGDGVVERHGSITRGEAGVPRLVRLNPDASLILDGVPLDAEQLIPGRDYSLQVGPNLLLIRGDSQPRAWRARFPGNAWLVILPGTSETLGPWALEDLGTLARRYRWDPKTIALPQGAEAGFYLRQLPGFETFAPADAAEGTGPAEPASEPQTYQPDASGNGALTCPVCWLRFDLGDIMHVAVHDSLRGDPLLGQDAPLRFHATRFNDRGQALDAFGLPSTDIACPHCRRILPPGFVEVEHHILSIVGDQSAGKSYYLSVLAHLLPLALFRHFGLNFSDADPAGNAMLNDMKRTLFGARRPEEARLVKTQLEGAMYERMPRYGRIVALPKPFVFYVQSLAQAERRASLIFYDNAGEHFQPGRDSTDSPGAQHVASSSGVLFLFDPFNHPGFRRRMGDHQDPQLERPVVDQQDVLLSELRVRVHRLLNLGVGQRLDRPLAVLVGKCDAWMHWLGREPFVDPVQSGCLDRAKVEQNSKAVRELLLELAPTIVGNAETTSSQVTYFPVSSFGHAPLKVDSGSYVPDPGQLQPILAEIPVLWILSIIRPDLVPSS